MGSSASQKQSTYVVTSMDSLICVKCDSNTMNEETMFCYQCAVEWHKSVPKLKWKHTK